MMRWVKKYNPTREGNAVKYLVHMDVEECGGGRGNQVEYNYVLAGEGQSR